MKTRCKIFSGTANRPLAAAIANELGVELGRCDIGRFPDGEVSVKQNDWPKLSVVSVAPLIGHALTQLIADGPERERAGKTGRPNGRQKTGSLRNATISRSH